MRIQHKRGYIIEGKGAGESKECFYMYHYGHLYSYEKSEFKRYRKPTQKKTQKKEKGE